MSKQKPLDENKQYDQSVQPKWYEKLFGILVLLFPWNWGK